MSPEPTARAARSGHDADATRRQRFGLALAVGLGLIAAGVSYFGTRDAWVVADRRPDAKAVALRAWRPTRPGTSNCRRGRIGTSSRPRA